MGSAYVIYETINREGYVYHTYIWESTNGDFDTLFSRIKRIGILRDRWEDTGIIMESDYGLDGLLPVSVGLW